MQKSKNIEKTKKQKNQKKQYSKDLLVAAQKPIFKAYKKDPAAHTLPSNFHEDCVWSQELLRKVLSGEDVPRTITIRGMSLLGSGSFESMKYHACCHRLKCKPE